MDQYQAEPPIDVDLSLSLSKRRSLDHPPELARDNPGDERMA
jgi:hypothetical protein